jgi:hypothetical protein
MNLWPLAHLQVYTVAIGQGEIENVKVWVNATEPQNSTAYFLLKFGAYPVKVEPSFLSQDRRIPQNIIDELLTIGKMAQTKTREQ